MATRTDALTEKLAEQPAPNGATGADVAVRQPDRAQSLLDGMRAEFDKCLPAILPVDMFMRVALTAFRKNPDLALCSRKSLMGALMECARLGLAPGTEEASLIPFKGEITLVIGYQGYVQLMYRSGQVERVEVEFVYAADEWEYTLGDGGRFWHKPNILAADRGEILFAYSYAKLIGDGRTKVAITTRHDALALQKQYGKGKDGKPNLKSAWHTGFEGMWAKTPVRRVQKFAPKSPELRRAAAMDGAVFDAAGQATTVLGEIVDPANMTIEGEVVETAVTPLSTQIVNLFAVVGLDTPEDRARYVAEAVGRDVESLAELSDADRAKVLAKLENFAAQQEPPAGDPA
jgi:recombination protein RecT